ncbi:hypothetical protein SAMN06265220_103633 [Flavobacterium nitrogenifigens]|uniref:Uncharacterized protein n=1 Tax=Flavobacterium nitrogenifigens TaxID=1617283 RepID=A0A521DY03_9FLAO|nr:hypothetical protein SAMN06265220_103633 [Flavobacterium nitrogenifigens]
MGKGICKTARVLCKYFIFVETVLEKRLVEVVFYKSMESSHITNLYYINPKLTYIIWF